MLHSFNMRVVCLFSTGKNLAIKVYILFLHALMSQYGSPYLIRSYWVLAFLSYSKHQEVVYVQIFLIITTLCILRSFLIPTRKVSSLSTLQEICSRHSTTNYPELRSYSDKKFHLEKQMSSVKSQCNARNVHKSEQSTPEFSLFLLFLRLHGTVADLQIGENHQQKSPTSTDGLNPIVIVQITFLKHLSECIYNPL